MDGRTTVAAIPGANRISQIWRWDKIPLRIPRLAGYDVVRVVLGLVLLTAAGFKGYQLATEPTLERGLLTSRWFLIAQVEFELFLGVFLLSGLYKRLIWRVTLVCYIGFSCVTLYKGLSGEASCGCFGKVELSPWYTFAGDITSVVLLLTLAPERKGFLSSGHSHRYLVRTVMVVLMVGATGGLAMAGFTPPSTGTLWGLVNGERGPSIAFDSTVHSFGNIYTAQKSMECEFPFHNEGTAELVIRKVRAACGCTVPIVSQERYLPGEKGTIRVKVNVSGLHGALDKPLLVWTNDPLKPYINLKIQGYVKNPPRVVPGSIAFGPLRSDQQQVKCIRITPDSKDAVPVIRRVSCDLDDVQIDLEEASANAEGRSLRITVKGGNTPVRKEGVIRIETSHPFAKSLNIPVTVEHAGSFDLSPSYIFLGKIGKGYAYDRSLLISSNSRRPFQLVSADSEGPWEVSLAPQLPLEGKASYVVHLRFHCREPTAGLVKGFLKFKTDERNQPFINLVVTGVH